MNILNKPILPDEIEWKIQSYTKDKSKTIIVPYITSRCVMERLDAEFGSDGWQTSFRIIEGHPLQTKDKRGNDIIKTFEGGVICALAVKVDTGWISKEDGASFTDIEPIKGGISDALKRAAHQYGLGRSLYSFPKVMVKGEHKFISEDIIKRLDKMVEAINSGDFNKPVVIL